MKRHIPQILTLFNLLSGCAAVVFAMHNQLELTAFFVCLGIAFDFFDGLAARAFKAQSAIGLQLDSLADMVTSGLVPGLVMYQLLTMSQTGGWNVVSLHNFELSSSATTGEILFPFCGFLITLASAYRLANFNTDEEQQEAFTGLPTPANALLVISLPLILMYQGNDLVNSIILNPWFLIVHIVLSSFLLNAPIKLFSLKFKNWDIKDNAIRYIFLLVSLVFLLTMKFLAIPAIVGFYIISSLVAGLGTDKKGEGL